VKLLLPLLFNIVMDKIVITVEKDRNSSQSKNLLQHVKVIIPWYGLWSVPLLLWIDTANDSKFFQHSKNREDDFLLREEKETGKYSQSHKI